MARGGRDTTGSFLEKRLNMTNFGYRMKGWALIDKIPTPWKVFYDRKSKQSKAFPDKKSTVDYIGIANGRPIAFDAKSTKERTSFPLKNVEIHQAEYMKRHRDQGGLDFLIVEFSKIEEVYLLPFDLFYPLWRVHQSGGRHSIPHQYFAMNCDRVVTGRGVPLDYLKHLKIR
jgi:recombination protein U